MSLLPELPTSRPSFKLAAVLVLCGAYVAVEIAAWFAFVPSAMSAQTFAWITALAFMATISAGAAIVGARPTRSIAHVLYEVENPARLPKI